MACSICREPGHTRPSCSDQAQRILLDIQAQRARWASRDLRQQHREDFYSTSYTEEDRADDADEMFERSATLAELVRKWRDAGGTLRGLDGGGSKSVPCLVRVEKDPWDYDFAFTSMVRVHRSSSVAVSRQLNALRASVEALRGTADPTTISAAQEICALWSRSPAAALWRFANKFGGKWPVSAAPVTPAAHPENAPRNA